MDKCLIYAHLASFFWLSLFLKKFPYTTFNSSPHSQTSSPPNPLPVTSSYHGSGSLFVNVTTIFVFPFLAEAPVISARNPFIFNTNVVLLLLPPPLPPPAPAPVDPLASTRNSNERLSLEIKILSSMRLWKESSPDAVVVGGRVAYNLMTPSASDQLYVSMGWMIPPTPPFAEVDARGLDTTSLESKRGCGKRNNEEGQGNDRWCQFCFFNTCGNTSRHPALEGRWWRKNKKMPDTCTPNGNFFLNSLNRLMSFWSRQHLQYWWRGHNNMNLLLL